jgi:hypothetical protein
LGVSLHNFMPFADIHSQDDEALIAILFVSLLQSGPLSKTVRSPGGPEVYQHHLAPEVAEAHFVALQVWQGKIRRRVTGDRSRG